MEADDYQPGRVKQDPTTKAVALRTNRPPPLEWFVGRVDNGGTYVGYDDVAEWADLN